jgi:DNA-binding FadR family transcriptional regulator
LSYKRAATNASPEQAEELILLGEQMVVASLEESSGHWTSVDAQFHEMVQNLSDNELIRAISLQIRRRVHRFWLRSASRHSRLNSCSEEHLELARAVQRRDLVAIELAVNNHINHMRKSVLDLVSQLESFVGDEFVGSSAQG